MRARQLTIIWTLTAIMLMACSYPRPVAAITTEQSTETSQQRADDNSNSLVIARDARNISAASAVFSLIALLLSGWRFFYEKNRDERQRRLSIEDEFWFRTVLGPSSIEPLIEHVQRTCTNLPDRTALTANLIQTYDSFLAEYQRRHGEVVTKLMMLTMFDGQLYKHITDKVDEIEDIVIIHCSLNRNSIPKTRKAGHLSFYERSEVTQVIYGKLTEALKIVRQSHHRL